jgi:hypothetical protein
MAAKHKKRSKKKIADEPVERSPFWAFAVATLLCLAALFFLFGGFGGGGKLPISLFHASYVIFGWAAYLMPVALFYWGITKFTTEGHRLSMGKFLGMLCILLFSAGLLYVALAARDEAGGWQGGHGGAVGNALGGMTLDVLDKLAATIFFVV